MHIPETMKAAILVKQDADLIVDNVQLPKNLGVGQVLVKIDKVEFVAHKLEKLMGKKVSIIICHIF